MRKLTRIIGLTLALTVTMTGTALAMTAEEYVPAPGTYIEEDWDAYFAEQDALKKAPKYTQEEIAAYEPGVSPMNWDLQDLHTEYLYGDSSVIRGLLPTKNLKGIKTENMKFDYNMDTDIFKKGPNQVEMWTADSFKEFHCTGRDDNYVEMGYIKKNAKGEWGPYYAEDVSGATDFAKYDISLDLTNTNLDRYTFQIPAGDCKVMKKKQIYAFIVTKYNHDSSYRQVMAKLEYAKTGDNTMVKEEAAMVYNGFKVTLLKIV